MCGRYAIRSIEHAAAAYEARHALNSGEFLPHFNAAPTQRLPILRRSGEGGGYELLAMAWGLTPSWFDGTSGPFNARVETVATNGMFRSAFQRRRCLVPADGFFEWKGPRPGEAKRPKVPHYVHRSDGEPFTFAGLWERRGGVETYCVITTPPNALMASIHDRQPAVIARSDADLWTSPDATPADLSRLLTPWSPDGWRSDVVSTRVNSPANDGPDLVEPVA